MGFALATTPPLKGRGIEKDGAIHQRNTAGTVGSPIGHGQNIPLTCSRPEQGRTRAEWNRMSWNGMEHTALPNIQLQRSRSTAFELLLGAPANIIMGEFTCVIFAGE